MLCIIYYIYWRTLMFANNADLSGFWGCAMSNKKERQLNCEVLRIVAMLMIVCLHYFGKGGLLGKPSDPELTAAGYTIWFLEALCLSAVNLYVLISGYFGGGTYSLQRPFRIWKQVFFYSVIIGIAAGIIGGQKPDIYRIFTYIFPIVTEHYWFATSYIILCLLMPFFDAGFAYFDKRQIKSIILVMLLLFSISKTVLPMQLPWDKYGYDAFWFMVLYLTGGYLRRYGVKQIKSRAKAALLYLGSVAMIFASFLVLRMVFLKTGKLEDLINYSYTYNYLFCYTAAVGGFIFFVNTWQDSPVLKRLRKPIELLSGATFGVYLIHEHIELRSQWPKWFHCEEQRTQSVGGLLVHMIFTVLTVYIICTAIEIIRFNIARLIFHRR